MALSEEKRRQFEELFGTRAEQPLSSPAPGRGGFSATEEIARLRNLRKPKPETTEAGIVPGAQFPTPFQEGGLFSKFAAGARRGIEAKEETFRGIEEAEAAGRISPGRAFAERAIGLPQVALPLARGVEEAVISPLLGAAGELVPDIVTEEGAALSPGAQFPSIVQTALEEFQNLDPETQRTLTNVGRSLESAAALFGGGAVAGRPAVRAGARRGVEAAREAARVAITPAAQLKKLLTRKRGDSVLETISPGINAAETRKIIEQGRLTRGRRSRLFGDKPDIVEQADEIQRAAQTIETKLGEGAAKMTDAQLSTALKSEVGTIAQTLRPQMKAIQLTPEGGSKLVSKWDEIKAAQAADSELGTVPGFKAFQNTFDSFVKDISKPVRTKTGQFRPKSLNDLWDIAIKYDGKISKRIKEAADIPGVDANLLFKKDMWFQNRQLLRDLLKDEAEGLGGTARTSFQEMSDLLTARNNIIFKAKVDLKGKPGIITDFFNNQAVRFGLLGLGVKELID